MIKYFFMRLSIFTIFCFFAFTSLPAFAQDAPVDGKQELLGIYEHLDEYVPDDVFVTNENGEVVNFKSLIDKPTILTLVYYTCPGICSPLLDGVAAVIGKTDLVLGKDYQVLTVSFNENETYQLAISKKKNYLQQVKKEIDESQWKWFTSDSLSISKLTNSVGFRFKREGNDFVHAAAIMVLSPDGKITRYLYGTYFLPFDMKMAIVEAAQGRSGPTINKVLNFCFSYDPEGKKYVFNITRIAATVIFGFAASLLLYLILSKKRRNHLKKV